MNKRYIAVLSAVIVLGAGITAYALPSPAAPASVSQSQQSAPVIAPEVPTPVVVQPKPSENITVPETVKPVTDTTPVAEAPKPVPEVHRDYCEASMPVGTLCLMRTMDGDLKGTVVIDEFNCKAAQITQEENPNANLATPSQTEEIESCPQ